MDFEPRISGHSGLWPDPCRSLVFAGTHLNPSTTSTPWDVPLIAVEFGVRRPLYDVIPERQKGDYLTGKYRYIAHFVERSYPTFLARSRPLAVPGGPMWATHLEKEAGECPHMTHNYLPYPGPNPEKLNPSFCAW